MKCKHCKRTIENNSIYCNWCGTKQIRQAASERIPKPRQLPSGAYTIQLMINKQRISNTFPTEQEAIAWAMEKKANAAEIASSAGNLTLQQALDKYIEDRKNILSPSTVRGYKNIAKKRFENLRKMKVANITNDDLQKAINNEAGKLSAKTLRNTYGLIYSACEKVCGITYQVTLPAKKPPRHNFIEAEHIPAFLEEIKGSRCEAAIILGLHSLRLSEILGLRSEDVTETTIKVHRTIVRGENGNVERDATKTLKSNREIPILIPRLKEVRDSIPINLPDKAIYREIERACKAIGIPNCGVHGLRHTFASLCCHLGINEMECQQLGGWSSNNILRSVYTHVSSADRVKAQQALHSFFAPKEETITNELLTESQDG